MSDFAVGSPIGGGGGGGGGLTTSRPTSNKISKASRVSVNGMKEVESATTVSINNNMAVLRSTRMYPTVNGAIVGSKVAVDDMLTQQYTPYIFFVIRRSG